MKVKSCVKASFLACLWMILPELTFSQYLVPRENELNWLVQKSDAIVIGEVIRLESQWNKDMTKIYTFAHLTISDSLKGHLGKHVVVEMLGGTVGAITMEINPSIEFHVGEKMLVFLTKSEGSDSCHVTDWKYGKFTILEKNAHNKVCGMLDTKTLIKRITSLVRVDDN